MKYITLLLKPVSSRCQLRCRYCFYLNEAENRVTADYGMMTSAVQRSIVTKVLNYFKEPVTITFMFQGGEPTLAGLAWYESFLSIVKENQKPWHTVNYAIQTNGMRIDEQWAEFFKNNHFLVGISIDGDIKTHNKNRIGSDGSTTYSKVISGYHLLRKKKVNVNVLSVLTDQLAGRPDKYYLFLKKEDILYAQIIPCLSPVNGANEITSLRPASYAKFFTGLFDLWMDETLAGRERHISLFDDILMLFQGNMPSECGRLGYCQAQYVVEGDGSVYPCDFYALDEWRCGSFISDTLEGISQNPKRNSFINRPVETFSQCKVCRYVNICNGGCPRERSSFLTDNYCGHYQLLKHIETKLLGLNNKR